MAWWHGRASGSGQDPLRAQASVPLRLRVGKADGLIISLPNLKPPVDRFDRLLRILALVGPGIFCVGYTIGTGAVTKLTSAGAQGGMQLLWALPLGCLLFWSMMEAYGRYTVVTGET